MTFEFTLLPIDVGFDLKVTRDKVGFPDGYSYFRVVYEDKAGNRTVTEGNKTTIRRALKAAGFKV
jgi:hypothetical protein